MSNKSDTKPEPITAKQNWHYDAYFLSQLDRLNNRELNTENPKQRKIEQNVKSLDIQVPEQKSITAKSLEDHQQNKKRNEVVQRINELAQSIGVSVTIKENPKLVS